LHLARVQHRWRYVDDELASSEGIDIDALAYDMAQLPAQFDGSPDAVAETLLNFFSASRSGGTGTGGVVEALPDEDGVLSTELAPMPISNTQTPEALHL
jgi:type IV secretion system protein VirD4